VYNPVDDKYIAQTFTADTLEQRNNKCVLQEEVGLEVNLHFNWHGKGGTKKELT